MQNHLAKFWLPASTHRCKASSMGGKSFTSAYQIKR